MHDDDDDDDNIVKQWHNYIYIYIVTVAGFSV
jgi:hypothetical protein